MTTNSRHPIPKPLKRPLYGIERDGKLALHLGLYYTRTGALAVAGLLGVVRRIYIAPEKRS